MRELCGRLWLLLVLAVFIPAQALSADAVIVTGGGMQRAVRLGMTKAELISELGAPSRIKSEGQCLQYDVFDLSLLLDNRSQVHRIYLGRNFTGSLQEQGGRWGEPEQVLAALGPPASVERLSYAPSPAVQNRATEELENKAGAVGAGHQALPMEYRGEGKGYELYGADLVLKYKAVFDDEGIAFWMDHNKELYATVLYPPSPGGAARYGMPVLESVYFEFDRFSIPGKFHPALERDARLLSEHPGLSVMVAGHTDALGSESYNVELSEKRARSVAEYLVKKGISASRLTAIGFGESQPIADNRTPQGRAWNRRVQFEAAPSAQETR
jgi:hypothetical protein